MHSRELRDEMAHTTPGYFLIWSNGKNCRNGDLGSWDGDPGDWRYWPTGASQTDIDTKHLWAQLNARE